MTRRVVITGVGMVTPVGATAEDSWTSLVNGKVGIEAIPEWEEVRFADKPLPVTIGALVKDDFDPNEWIEPKKDVRRMDVFLQFAMGAAHQAWTQSGLPAQLDDEAGNRAGCIVGVGLGGIQTIIHAWEVLKEKGPRRISPFFIPGIVGNMAPGYAAIRYNLRGANWAPASACSSGGHGIGEAAQHILEGRADVMLAGGAEAGMHPITVAGFASMHAMCASHNDNPKAASRPFDKTRDGFVLGEGAGMMVLEELEHAKARGANILAELVGYGSTGDAHHITAPAPEGEGAQRAMRDALAMAKMNGPEVGYINAHGTSTPYNDKNETGAVKNVFGDHAKKLMMSSTKSMTGHLLGGAGGVEGVISVLSMTRGVLPPTMNLHEPDPECDLDYIPNEAREVKVDAVMSNSFGFGGTNAVLIFKRFDG
jgi:3-oxoacyl-[acyl-carrier-protein] synthase II